MRHDVILSHNIIVTKTSIGIFSHAEQTVKFVITHFTARFLPGLRLDKWYYKVIDTKLAAEKYLHASQLSVRAWSSRAGRFTGITSYLSWTKVWARYFFEHERRIIQSQFTWWWQPWLFLSPFFSFLFCLFFFLTNVPFGRKLDQHCLKITKGTSRTPRSTRVTMINFPVQSVRDRA